MVTMYRSTVLFLVGVLLFLSMASLHPPGLDTASTMSSSLHDRHTFAGVSAAPYAVPAGTLLREFLFNEAYYDYNTPPATEENATAYIPIGLGGGEVDDLASVNFVDGYLAALGLQRLTWTDWRLQWDPEDYGGLESIWVTGARGDDQIMWVPMLVFRPRYQSHDETFSDTNARVYANGTVVWYRNYFYKFFCEWDNIANFPFDKQHCFFFMGTDDQAYFYIPEDVTFYHDEDDLDYAEFYVTEISYEKDPDIVYPEGAIKITIEIERSSASYWVRIIIPSCIVTYLSFCAFIISPKAGERISLGITALLSFLAINFILNEFIPLTPEPVWMDAFILTSFCFTAASVAESAIVLHLYTKASNFRMKGAMYGGAVRKLWKNRKHQKRDVSMRRDELGRSAAQLDKNTEVGGGLTMGSKIRKENALAASRAEGAVHDDDVENSRTNSDDLDNDQSGVDLERGGTIEMDMYTTRRPTVPDHRHEKFLNVLLMEAADSASLKLSLADAEPENAVIAEKLVMQKFYYLTRCRVISEWIDFASIVVFPVGYTVALMCLFFIPQ
eukprot:TRINITY_DN2876_c1_g1_i1.p1 TRINITY_DN2876_c1_g1~~TRINITY_DN2876_c1_g1_i1.p1  ORF type:complete len:557 (-),score=116.22 TRINITY_DN2876_c1_g1_i1:103-1773(-)